MFSHDRTTMISNWHSLIHVFLLLVSSGLIQHQIAGFTIFQEPSRTIGLCNSICNATVGSTKICYGEANGCYDLECVTDSLYPPGFNWLLQPNGINKDLGSHLTPLDKSNYDIDTKFGRWGLQIQRLKAADYGKSAFSAVEYQTNKKCLYDIYIFGNGFYRLLSLFWFLFQFNH